MSQTITKALLCNVFEAPNHYKSSTVEGVQVPNQFKSTNLEGVEVPDHYQSNSLEGAESQAIRELILWKILKSKPL